MAEFTHQDRLILNMECRLWVAVEILNDMPDCHWTKSATEIRNSLLELAREVQDYNDQFEFSP